jgi:hypothetical protein
MSFKKIITQTELAAFFKQHNYSFTNKHGITFKYARYQHIITAIIKIPLLEDDVQLSYEAVYRDVKNFRQHYRIYFPYDLDNIYPDLLEAYTMGNQGKYCLFVPETEQVFHFSGGLKIIS